MSSTMVMVNWENVPAIDQNGIITNYEVLFEPLEFTSALTVALLNATNMSVIFPNLEEFVEYNISVRAYTVMGPGPFSSAVENRTLEDGKLNFDKKNHRVIVSILSLHQFPPHLL